mgnify:CR=1 FL=1
MGGKDTNSCKCFGANTTSFFFEASASGTILSELLPSGLGGVEISGTPKDLELLHLAKQSAPVHTQ